MSPTANADLYLCKIERRMYLEELGATIDYYDCAIEFGADGYRFRQYDIPPFQIIIRNPNTYPGQSGTFIKKLVSLQFDHHMPDMAAYKVYKELFNTAAELELPWGDHAKCVEKINKLIIFS